MYMDKPVIRAAGQFFQMSLLTKRTDKDRYHFSRNWCMKFTS